MRRLFIFAIITAIFIFVSTTPSHALWWMVYHKPAFNGKVIDAETKEPIEGAVVVVTYSKHIFRFMPESGSVIMDVREALTDKDGKFYFPSYTTVIDPLAWESWIDFIIFKPGYGSFPNYHTSPPKVGIDHEEFFSTGKTGEKGEMVWKGIGERFKVTFGIVELPKLKTREERIKASMVGITGYHAKDLPLLYKSINEEERYLGIPERE